MDDQKASPDLSRRSSPKHLIEHDHDGHRETRIEIRVDHEAKHVPAEGRAAGGLLPPDLRHRPLPLVVDAAAPPRVRPLDLVPSATAAAALQAAGRHLR